MAAAVPGRGPVVVGSSAQPTTVHAPSGSLTDGTWRPDYHFAGDGLWIALRAAHGITDPACLRVPLRLQVPVLGDLARQHIFAWSRYDTLRLGQRSRRMGPELFELALSTVLMDASAQDSSSGIVVWPYAPEPQKIIDELRFVAGMSPGGKATPFRLTVAQPAVWGDAPLINLLAVLTRVAPTQRPDEPGTEYLDLTFLEFYDDEVGRRRQPRGDEVTRFHDLKAGESLYDIARRYYHQPSAWRRVADANGITRVRPGSDSDLAAWAKRHHKRTLRIPPAPRAR